MAKTRRSVPKGHQSQKKSGNLPLFIILGGVAILIIAAFFAFQKKPSSFTPEVAGKPNHDDAQTKRGGSPRWPPP